MTKDRSSRKWRGQSAKTGKAGLRPSERRKLRAGAATPGVPTAALSTAPVVIQGAKPPRSELRQKLAEKREGRRSLKDQRRRTFDGTSDTLKLLQTTMKVVANSQKSFKDVYLDGGPCPATLAKWQREMVRKPGLMTVLGALQACGNLSIAIIDENGQIVA